MNKTEHMPGLTQQKIGFGLAFLHSSSFFKIYGWALRLENKEITKLECEKYVYTLTH
jgi:hypothetical protein